MFFYFCIGVDNRKIKIYDKEAELWTDLSAIDARRENLIETLNSLRSTPYTSKSSMKPDSGVDVRPNYDTSIDEKKISVVNITSANVISDTAENFDHTKYPKVRFLFMEEKKVKKR